MKTSGSNATSEHYVRLDPPLLEATVDAATWLTGLWPAWPTAYRRFAQGAEARGRTGDGGDLPGWHQPHRVVSLRVHPAE
jgi:hypothetical protein